MGFDSLISSHGSLEFFQCFNAAAEFKAWAFFECADIDEAASY
jgi:hypothetical protein